MQVLVGAHAVLYYSAVLLMGLSVIIVFFGKMVGEGGRAGGRRVVYVLM